MARARRAKPARAIMPLSGNRLRIEVETSEQERGTLERLLAGVNAERQKRGLPPCSTPADFFSIGFSDMVKQQIALQEQRDALAWYGRLKASPPEVQRKVAELLRI